MQRAKAERIEYVKGDPPKYFFQNDVSQFTTFYTTISLFTPSYFYREIIKDKNY